MSSDSSWKIFDGQVNGTVATRETGTVFGELRTLMWALTAFLTENTVHPVKFGSSKIWYVVRLSIGF